MLNFFKFSIFSVFIMNRIGFKSIVAAAILTGFSASAAQAEEAFFVGHSLVNFDMPRMLDVIAGENQKQHSSDLQIINGSSLKYNWENSERAQGSDSRVVLPQGGHSVLVFTESVPLLNSITWNDSSGFATNFYDLAVSSNADTRVFLYETWHCINSGLPEGCEWDEEDEYDWRARLDRDLPRWEGIAEGVEAARAGSSVSIIPGGQAMAALSDAIDDGEVSELSSVRDLYKDDIHLTDVGNYYIALVNYMTIYGERPEVLPTSVANQYGQEFDVPPPSLSQKFRAIAWSTVCGYEKSGVDCEQASPPEAPSNVTIRVINNP